jgi:hypothetical protein
VRGSLRLIPTTDHLNGIQRNCTRNRRRYAARPPTASPLLTAVFNVHRSARGIGKAIALRLADDGFDVALNDIPANTVILDGVVNEIKAKGRASSAHLGDVSLEDDVRGMVEQVVSTYGNLDVVRIFFVRTLNLSLTF